MMNGRRMTKLALGVVAASAILLLTAERSLAGGSFSFSIGTTLGGGHAREGRGHECSTCKPASRHGERHDKAHRGTRHGKPRHGFRPGWQGRRRPPIRRLGRGRVLLGRTRVIYIGPRTVIIRPPIFHPKRRVKVIRLGFSW